MIQNSEKLFSYGTLRQENVQISSFGRLLNGVSDKIRGYRLDQVEINDIDVISKSGKNVHDIMVFTGNDNDTIDGIVYDITKEELKIADNYEVDDYERKKMNTISGAEVWVYIAA